MVGRRKLCLCRSLTLGGRLRVLARSGSSGRWGRGHDPFRDQFPDVLSVADVTLHSKLDPWGPGLAPPRVLRLDTSLWKVVDRRAR